MTEVIEFMRSLGIDCPDPDALDYGGLIGNRRDPGTLPTPTGAAPKGLEPESV
jgi:hypothetical protein